MVLAKKAIGKSRGGYTTKIHALINEYFQLEQGATVCVPDKSNTVVKHNFDEELYKQRNIVERFFQRIKEFRHISSRFDKLDICFLNFIFLAAFIRHL
ncbi:MAG: transposase [Selenomonadaceae bacterium]|nr:transposase [Selenomonadaceae bacterium]